jgi:PAS domain S-box-containing protein
LEQLRRDLRSDCDTHEAEYRIRHEDGGWRWVLDRCRVLERDRTDRPVHIAGLLLDITARKTRELALESSEEALAGSEALFRSAAMLAPGYVWEARFTPGYTARIIRASGGFERVMRCTVEEFERAGSWQGFVADESRVVAFDAMSRLFAGEANLTVELKLRRADDTELWLLVRAQSVRDPVTGQAIGAIGSSEDVTERHRADEALKRSQAQLMTIAASTADWLVLLDASQRVLFLNKPLVGRSPAEIVGRPIGEVAPPGAAEYLRNLVAKVLATGEPVDVEQEYFDPAAGHRVFELRVRAVRSGERVAGAVINATEVTRRREADELRRTQARMLETLREAVAVIQSDGVIRLANPAFERLFEFAPGTAVGHSLVPLLVVPDVDPSMGVERLMSEAMTRTEGAPLEFVCVSCAGAEFTAACVASRMELNDGEHWLIALTDVTERKRMEREILEIASREQLRIGSDLHDGLGQDLTGIALMLRSVSVQLRKEGSKMRAEIDDVIGLVNTAIESTRAMARGLSPVGADRGGLISGLQMMAARGVERYGVRTELTTRLNQPLSIDDATASHLYRIAQEALTNAIRHGHVTQVSVDLYTGDGVLVLTVADNGRGLPVSGRSTDGMGLKLMRYRAQMVQGDLTVTNHPDGGVMVQCTCPHRALEETGPTRSGGFPLKD